MPGRCKCTCGYLILDLPDTLPPHPPGCVVVGEMLGEEGRGRNSCWRTSHVLYLPTCMYSGLEVGCLPTRALYLLPESLHQLANETHTYIIYPSTVVPPSVLFLFVLCLALYYLTLTFPLSQQPSLPTLVHSPLTSYLISPSLLFCNYCRSPPPLLHFTTPISCKLVVILYSVFLV
ncbi:hypothetical protein F4808DRAFT_97885 [Astrocystis sublimbata]|nr:hypothetical protein F4808DRAFT_97885 [Astrocystis sublimbata]